MGLPTLTLTLTMTQRAVAPWVKPRDRQPASTHHSARTRHGPTSLMQRGDETQSTRAQSMQVCILMHSAKQRQL